jgi:hypothetical protein
VGHRGGGPSGRRPLASPVTGGPLRRGRRGRHQRWARRRSRRWGRRGRRPPGGRHGPGRALTARVDLDAPAQAAGRLRPCRSDHGPARAAGCRRPQRGLQGPRRADDRGRAERGPGQRRDALSGGWPSPRAPRCR